jgi:hypothetical protein
MDYSMLEDQAATETAGRWHEGAYPEVLAMPDHPDMRRPDWLWWGAHCTLDAELIRDFGIRCSDYYKVAIKQNYRCKVCHKRYRKRRLGVDHNPDTMKFRGLLCDHCQGIVTPDLVDYIENPPADEFDIKVSGKRLVARDKRQADKREETRRRRAKDAPMQQLPTDSSYEEFLKQAERSSA